MLPDDIPIQGPNGDSTTVGSGGLSSTGGSSNASQLVSISEESDGEPRPAGRASKDTPKVHKVPFLAFKTSKDKDKDKNNGLPLINAASDAKDGNSIVSKSAHKKEKFSNRVSSSSLLMTSGDSTDAIEKVSPSITRQKSSQNDLATTATNGVEGLSLQLLSNGGQSVNGDGLKALDSLNNSLDVTLESMDSSPDAPSQRTSIIGDVKSHMQVSQV